MKDDKVARTPGATTGTESGLPVLFRMPDLGLQTDLEANAQTARCQGESSLAAATDAALSGYESFKANSSPEDSNQETIPFSSSAEPETASELPAAEPVTAPLAENEKPLPAATIAKNRNGETRSINPALIGAFLVGLLITAAVLFYRGGNQQPMPPGWNPDGTGNEQADKTPAPSSLPEESGQAQPIRAVSTMPDGPVAPDPLANDATPADSSAGQAHDLHVLELNAPQDPAQAQAPNAGTLPTAQTPPLPTTIPANPQPGTPVVGNPPPAVGTAPVPGGTPQNPATPRQVGRQVSYPTTNPNSFRYPNEIPGIRALQQPQNQGQFGPAGTPAQPNLQPGVPANSPAIPSGQWQPPTNSWQPPNTANQNAFPTSPKF